MLTVSRPPVSSGLLAGVNTFLDTLLAADGGVIGFCRATGSLTLFAGVRLSAHRAPAILWAAVPGGAAGNRLFQPAGRRTDRDLHRHGAGVAVLHRVFPLRRQSAVANLVVMSMTRELGPVLAGLMVAGRVGAAMAAEIGTMRVTDQIDALRLCRPIR